ncbi:ABC transporter permease [Chitinophaga solisilvae]|uniref:ABC transporter permease n=1 Tax=Chitinophaga solisilvae TaxID=1233460 RepID=UPI00136A59D4|nr:ABC transporter permease [Chitinophaga solisilvae]
MLLNYFRIAWRNLWRSKGYSAINILGLAIGLATCLLITLFVADELSYDRHHRNADRIFRINADFLVNGNAFRERQTPAPLAAVLKKDYPAVENTARLLSFGDRKILVKKGRETLMEENTVAADGSIFDVFTIPLVSGDAKTALSKPFTMAISESMALKYFNSTDIIGKTLQTDNVNTYEVTAVFRDMPATSHLHLNFIRSLVGNPEDNDNWMSDNFDTYVLVRKGIGEKELNQYMKEITKNYMETSLKTLTGSDIADIERSGGHFRYDAIPLTKIHLHSDITAEIEPSGNIQYVYIFCVAALFILLIACVNFMNLSTARSAGRAKEVGVRKALGSHRSHLIVQFLVESVLTSCIALVLALCLTFLLLPYLNQLSGKAIGAGMLLNRWLLPALIGVIIVVGLLAGSYPAFFLSSFEPVKVLKGKLASGFRGSWLRNSLVVFQFSTAIILIIGTLVIYSQLGYIRNRQLGYDREQVLVLNNTASLWIHAKAFRAEVLQLPGVKSGTMTAMLPTSLMQNTAIYSKDAARSAGQVMGLAEWNVDADYIPTLGMEMAAGRNFSPRFPTDTNTIIVNETAAKLLGFTDLNNRILYAGGQPFNVIGIVKDFNTGSLRTKIPPVVMRLASRADCMAFRVMSNDFPGLIRKIENLYHATPGMTGQPFRHAFLDEDFNRLYLAEERTGKIFLTFAAFAILISCLGLFGLVTYAAEQRTREISIRKVLGASATGIVRLLSGDFLKLVAIAILVSSPLAWLLMNQWLQGFAYRIHISWWIFAATAILAVVITLVTVCTQAIRSALANPVESLR